jgi:hypothetical protein
MQTRAQQVRNRTRSRNLKKVKFAPVTDTASMKKVSPPSQMSLPIAEKLSKLTHFENDKKTSLIGQYVEGKPVYSAVRAILQDVIMRE